MEGATTAEAIAEKRAAEFEAAEAARLKVRQVAAAPRHSFCRAAALSPSQRSCLEFVKPRSDYSEQALFENRLSDVLLAVLTDAKQKLYVLRMFADPCRVRQELEEEEAALWAQQLVIAREEGERARVRYVSKCSLGCLTAKIAATCEALKRASQSRQRHSWSPGHTLAHICVHDFFCHVVRRMSVLS